MARVRTSLLAASVAAGTLLAASPAHAAAPPTPVTSLAATPASRQVTLAWTNPADPDFAGVTVVVKTGAAPATVDDGTTVYEDSGQSTVVTGLTNGTTYGFAVFTRNTAGDVSPPATTTAAPVPALTTRFGVIVSPAKTSYGRSVAVYGVLRRGDTGTGIPNTTVDVYRRIYGQSTFLKVARLTTNSTGHVAYRSTGLLKHTYWYLQHPEDPFYAASHSATLTTLVAPRLTVTISASTVEQNVASIVRGSVTPNHAGLLTVLQQYTGSAWKNVAYRKLSDTSGVRLDIKSATIGSKRFRIYVTAHGDHSAVYSPSFVITTIRRTIRPGMCGADVTWTQRRLAGLHYDVPSADGCFGYDTVHATAAFQKVEGLAVNGTVDPATYARLKAPRGPRLRYPRAGSWVEVDLTKQVLYYGRDGGVLRMLDVSSGSGQLFTVDGETKRAVTPTGSFRIFHKIDGLRVSRLGSLWRPAYFASGGYAIHGSSSVPYYPASHGCIRITNSAMNRIFGMLAIGMPVYVYRS